MRLADVENWRRILPPDVLRALVDDGPRLDVPTPHECSFERFCTDRLVAARRPFGRTVSRGTYECMARHLRSAQMGRLLGDDGAPLSPPDWPAFLALLRAHKKGPQSLENQRRALVWWSAYYRVAVPDEPWARKRLDDKKSVAQARRDGTMSERVRFFRPEHLQRLVAKDVPAWENRRVHHAERLNHETFRTIVFTSVYVGPRGGEPWYWRLGDFDARMGRLRVWAQKQGKRRDVQPPERYAFGDPRDENGGMLDPNLLRYVANVRPLLDPEEKFSSPDDPLFLFMHERSGKVATFENDETGQRHGWPTEEAYRMFVSRGIRKVLGDEFGDDVAAPHGLRRACATLRYRHGASVEQIASFIEDEENTIRRSYLDREWLRSPGNMPLPPPRVGLAKIPRLRPDQFIANGRAPRGAAAAERGDDEHDEAA